MARQGMVLTVKRKHKMKIQRHEIEAIVERYNASLLEGEQEMTVDEMEVILGVEVERDGKERQGWVGLCGARHVKASQGLARQDKVRQGMVYLKGDKRWQRL